MLEQKSHKNKDTKTFNNEVHPIMPQLNLGL